MRENSYNQWKNACDGNLSYANRTSTSTVLGNRGNNQSGQFDSSSNVDVGSKCNVDAFSGRNGNKYDCDMHVEVRLQHRVEDEAQPDKNDVGISLDSDVDEEGAGSKCNIDAFSGRNGNKYDCDMHIEL